MLNTCVDPYVWSALFADLVAAIAHAIPEDEDVWIDML